MKTIYVVIEEIFYKNDVCVTNVRGAYTDIEMAQGNILMEVVNLDEENVTINENVITGLYAKYEEEDNATYYWTIKEITLDDTFTK